MSEQRNPVLVGQAQFVQRDADLREALEPLAMLEQVARHAARDAGAGERLLRELDTVAMVDVMGWKPGNGPRLLAERLGAHPAREYVSAIGGEIPLTLVNHVAAQIARGEARLALVAGCNATRTLRRARAAEVDLAWARGGEGEPTGVGENRPGSSEDEQRYGLRLPVDVYPVFENALRHRRGLDLETHRQRVGALFSGFTRVAAKNPYAWFPVERSAEEITTVGPANRMIAFPYTKYLNAILETDQAAAVLLASQETARALAIPEDHWVYWRGGHHDQEQAWFPSERATFTDSHALRRTAHAALAQAGVSMEQVDSIDFYSCFPAAVEMACEMLGVAQDDPRGLTVTGGLPYAGGPGSSYTLHALAATMERLREAPGSTGLITGNGWYLTKHSALVCASAPGGEDGTRRTRAPEQAEQPADDGPVPVVQEAVGRGRIEAYTVRFDREGAPARGIALGRLDDGRRFIANTPEDRQLLEAFVASEQVGRAGRLSQRDGRNCFEPA